MADDLTSGLKLKIEVDPSNSAAEIGAFDARLAKLELQFAKISVASTAAGAATTAHGTTHVAAGAAVEKHAQAESLLGISLGRAESATFAAARAAGALGFETAAATERVVGLSEALDGLGKTAGPLIALGAALLALGQGFNFIAEGVKNAAKEQVALQAIVVGITDQKRGWTDAREEIEKFATVLGRATTFSRGEAIDAIHDLTTAGITLGDSQQIVTVATDVAAGSGRTLTEVTHLLLAAEAGRAMGLIRLDPHLKDVIAKHHDLKSVLEELSRVYSGQAADATTTFAGKQKMLQDKLQELGEELGTRLLPALTMGADLLISFATEAETQMPVWLAWGKGVMAVVQDVIDKFKELNAFFKPLSDVLNTMATMSGASGRASGRATTEATTPGHTFKTARELALGLPAGTEAAAASRASGANVGGQGGGFELAGGGSSGNSLVDAINKSAAKYATTAGISADRLSAIMTAIGMHETGLGTSPAYNAATGRSRNPKNLAVGDFQLDPSSGASAADLERARTDPAFAADYATKMEANFIKTHGGNVFAGVKAYNGTGPDATKYAKEVLGSVNAQGRGKTGISWVDNAALAGDASRATYDEEMTAMRARFARRTLDENTAVGKTKGSGGTPLEPTAYDDVTKTTQLEAAQKRLDKALQASHDGMLRYSEAVKTATTEEGKKAATIEVAIQSSERAGRAIVALTAMNAAEGAEVAKLNVQHAAQIVASHNAVDALNAYKNKLGEAGASTKEEHAELRKLELAHTAASKAVVTSATEISRLTDSMDRNAHAMAEAKAHTSDYAAVTAAAAIAQQKLNEKMEAADKKTREKIAKSDETVVDEKMMYGKSLAVQREYLLQKYHAAVLADRELGDEAVRIHEQINRLDIESNKKAVDEYKKRVTEQIKANEALATRVYDFFDQAHQRGETAFQAIGHAFTDMLKSMEKSLITSTMAKIFGNITGTASGPVGFGFGTPGGTAGAAPGVADIKTATQATADNTAAIASQLGATGMGIPQSAGGGTGVGGILASIIGGGGGVAGSGLNESFGGWGDPTTSGSSKGGLSGLFGGLIKGGLASTLQTALTGIGFGAALGSLGGNSGNAMIGSILGTGLGFLGGPLGAKIGGALGGLIGGMTGPHWGPPENYPDRSDTQRYRQTIQDLIGGTSQDNAFSLQSSISSVTGGKGESSFIQSMLARGKPSWMDDAEFKQASGFFGTDPNAVLKHGTHIGDLSYGNGSIMTYVTAAELSAKILQQYQNAGGASNSPIPVFDVKRSMPNYNVGSLIAGGMFDPTTGKMVGAPPPAGAYPWNDPRIPPNGIHPITQPVININIGSVDNQQRVLQISRALNDVYRLNMGGSTNSLNGYAQ